MSEAEKARKQAQAQVLWEAVQVLRAYHVPQEVISPVTDLADKIVED